MIVVVDSQLLLSIITGETYYIIKSKMTNEEMDKYIGFTKAYIKSLEIEIGMLKSEIDEANFIIQKKQEEIDSLMKMDKKEKNIFVRDKAINSLKSEIAQLKKNLSFWQNKALLK